MINTGSLTENLPTGRFFVAHIKAFNDLYESVLDAGLECVQIGDNVRPGKIIDAISQGYNYIRVLE